MGKLSEAIFKPKFGTWWPKIKPFFDGGGLDKIYRVLKEESSRGIRIVPNSEDVFKCFRATPLNELKAVVMGFCPYHTMIESECVADGLMSSCSKTGILQPSLEQLYNAWEEEFNNGLCLGCDRNPDLTYLAEQGVLLFNSALTTKAGIAGAHQELWEPFTKYVLEEIISVTGVPVVLLGKQAQEFAGCVNFSECYSLSHPASASYKKEKWNSHGVFRAVNETIRGMNGEEINWLLEPAPF
jgi:uracil-DNA glycosylase